MLRRRELITPQHQQVQGYVSVRQSSRKQVQHQLARRRARFLCQG
jgi:hypothetical protein